VNTRQLVKRGLAASLLVPLLGGAGCFSSVDSGEGQPEALGSAEDALQVHEVFASPYPGLNQSCHVVSSPQFSLQSNGFCAGKDSSTFQRALKQCGGAVQYFNFTCEEYAPWSTYSLTAYVNCCAPCTNGTGINLETRQFMGPTGPNTTSQAKELFNRLPVAAPGSGYGYDNMLTASAFSNHSSLPGGVNTNIAYHFKASIKVEAANVGTWKIRLAADFGYGGALLVDGVEVQSRWFPTNAGDGLHACALIPNWNDTTQILEADTIAFGAGTHDIEVYGFENGYDCASVPTSNDPLMQLQYMSPTSSDWALISTSALPLCGR
jgi:hypothetical protein